MRLSLALLVLVSVALAPPAEAQPRSGDTATLLLGGSDVLYAALVAAASGPLTPRTDLSRLRALTFTGVSSPRGAAGGTCDFEAPTCDGTLRVRTTSAPAVTLCYALKNVSITVPLSTAAAGGYSTEQVSITFTQIERDGPCPSEE